MMVTKADLVEIIRHKTKCTPAAAQEIWEALVDAMKDGAANGGVELRGFVTIKAKQRGPRVGRNPKTGESVAIPPRKFAHFKPSRQFNDALNG